MTDYAEAHVPVEKNQRRTGLRRGDGEGRLGIRHLWYSEGAEMREKAKTIEGDPPACRLNASVAFSWQTF